MGGALVNAVPLDRIAMSHRGIVMALHGLIEHIELVRICKLCNNLMVLQRSELDRQAGVRSDSMRPSPTSSLH